MLEKLTQLRQKLATVPRKYWAIGGVLLVVIVYSLIFFIPKKVDFAYAGESCVQQLVLFPDAQTKSSDEFTVVVNNEFKIGSFAYAATQVCVTPKVAPQPGTYSASVGLFGGWFANKQFAVQVSEPPVANAADVTGKAISAALPLKVGLTGADTIHTYELAIAEKVTPCDTEQAQLTCDVEKLELKPGADYTAELLRSYRDDEPVTIIKGEVETLVPVVLKQASLTNEQVIYDTAKSFTFSFDQQMNRGEVTLTRKDGETIVPLETTVTAEADKLIVTVKAELPRKAELTLTLKQVVATTGSSLEAPHTVQFTTSGGPKPKQVSVGATGVPQNARIVVTFDQLIKEGADIAKFVRIEGANGSVSQQSPTELVFSVNAGLCQAYSLVLDKGLESEVNKEVSEEWKFNTRTICGTSSVIGRSVQGRPLVAHYFGNGMKTILFTGGIHGNERSAQQTMQGWVDYLMVTPVPANTRVVVVPNLNPDGVATGSRNNANNVNLGRNYPSANWSASIDTASGVLPTGGGTSAGSEPETQAIMALTRQLQPRLQVSFHSQGRLVGANKVGDSVAIGDTYAGLVGYGTMYHNAEEVMGYSITGEYEEWMGEKLGIPAILIELPSHSGNYLNSQLSALRKILSL